MRLAALLASLTLSGCFTVSGLVIGRAAKTQTVELTPSGPFVITDDHAVLGALVGVVLDLATLYVVAHALPVDDGACETHVDCL